MDYTSAPLHIIGTFRYKHTLNGHKRIPYLTRLSVFNLYDISKYPFVIIDLSLNSLQYLGVVTVHYILFEFFKTYLGDNVLWIGYCP